MLPLFEAAASGLTSLRRPSRLCRTTISCRSAQYRQTGLDVRAANEYHLRLASHLPAEAAESLFARDLGRLNHQLRHFRLFSLLDASRKPPDPGARIQTLCAGSGSSNLEECSRRSTIPGTNGWSSFITSASYGA